MAIRFVDHKIQKSLYNGLEEVGAMTDIRVSIHGSILVSKESLPGSIDVSLTLEMGEGESNLAFKIVTETVFEYTNHDDALEDEVKKECVPVAVKKTRVDTEKLLSDIGFPLSLPDSIWNWG